VLLNVSNLTVCYDKAMIINDISMHVNQGELVSLVGPNGAGKSTLLRAITGLVIWEKGIHRGTAEGDITLEGTVIFKNQHLERVPAHEIAQRGLIHCPERRRPFREMTVLENLYAGAYLTKEKQQQRPYKLHLAVAPTKINDRYEWFLEKATEIGIDAITPIICDHSERKVIKTQRFEKILQSAMKQSLNCYLPKLNEAIAFKDFVIKDFKGQKSKQIIAFNNNNNLQEPPNSNNVIKMKSYFPGTLISLKFYIDEKYLEGKIINEN